MARRLLLVPVLVVALFVTVLEASGTPPAGRGWNTGETPVLRDTPPGWSAAQEHRPAGVGDGRRIK